MFFHCDDGCGEIDRDDRERENSIRTAFLTRRQRESRLSRLTLSTTVKLQWSAAVMEFGLAIMGTSLVQSVATVTSLNRQVR